MDQAYILTKARLKLAYDIEASKPEHGILILKNVPLKTYLVVEEDQWWLLRKFREGVPLQELLPKLITDRKCPPLRSLYELVMKAVVTGVLEVDDQCLASAPKQNRAVEWDHGLRFGMAHYFGVAAILFGTLTVLFRPLGTPTNLLEILIGWLLICGCLTVGYFLSACLLVGFDREVYDTRFRWKHAFPHFCCNVEDGRMGGRLCEMSVALMQMAPMFFITGIAAIWYPHLVYVLLLGVFFITAPTGRSPASLLLRSLYRRYPLSTTHDFIFVQNRLLWTLINARIKFTDKSYLLIFGAFTFVWLFTVFLANLSAFDLNLRYLTDRYVQDGGAALTVIIVLIQMAATVLGSLAMISWIAAKNVLHVIEQLQARKQKPGPMRNHEISTEAVTQYFSETLLLKGVNAQILDELAQRVEGVVVDPKQYVCKEGEVGEHLYFVYDGGVEVLMELKSGRPLKITELGVGDVFGEIALLYNVPRTRSIRAARKSLLLAISRDDFQQLIVRSLGARDVEEIIRKQSFLHRIDLCRNWHPQALTSFSRLANIAEFKAGDTVIRKGMRNQFFYLIYDGLLEVVADSKRVAKLATGEFFGEISLLQNSTATADIVAITDSHCLVVQRRDFLQFIGKDFLVGLQFEDISSKRLKHPIFPLTGVAYDDFPDR
ncbi:cyclic nucleotide-binding domain-containing protein [Cerasicoccus fimbriatus]|uniref:cyclic nucleotide-binding domain-containing protein n=1 Tax=Cerasicoccus fimbriatus TaxID=3014554 RepID=UPI0022B4329C|nr:cyclic nucleotide-binding domain-containing protein [Cerasicoccus sp. TK19100]